MTTPLTEGIYPIAKPKGVTSFALVHALRRLTGIEKIGHAGTLDPFADGVMLLLIGRTFTRQADTFRDQDKEYRATLTLGSATTTFDPEGEMTHTSSKVPTLAEVEEALSHFQGTCTQIPPMYSAKKVAGKKLYELARKGIEIPREPITVTLDTKLLSYEYPHLELLINCSKGTYIRTIGHDLALRLGTYGHLTSLTRTRSGSYHLSDCIDGAEILTKKKTPLLRSVP